MSKLRVLSGKELVAILTRLGFTMRSQQGSHIKMELQTANGRIPFIIPNHKELRRGTVRSIYLKIIRYVPEQDVRSFFFTQ